MRILYFGLPLGALLLAADGVDVVHAVMGRREALGLRRLRYVLGDERVSFAAGKNVDAHLAQAILGRSLEVDLVVSWFFPKKLPRSVLTLGRWGSVGVHPSLLPRHRGPDPYFAAIDCGDTVTGVTAHRLEAEYDTGAMLDRETLAIDPRWNAWTLAKRLDRPSLRVLRRVVAAFARDPLAVRETPQEEADASAAPEPTEAQLLFDDSMTAERALRRIRAAAPWPGITLWIDEECIEIERAAIAPNHAGLAPGEIGVLSPTAARPGEVLVGVRQGALRLERVRVLGDDDSTTLEGDAFCAWAAERGPILRPMPGV